MSELTRGPQRFGCIGCGRTNGTHAEGCPIEKPPELKICIGCGGLAPGPTCRVCG